MIAEFKSYTLRGTVIMKGFDTLYIEYYKNNRLIIPGSVLSLTFYKHFGEDKPLQNYYVEPRPSKDTLARLRRRNLPI